ncbi:hypothetical protein Tco_1372744 [Tanacetum coccineum]
MYHCVTGAPPQGWTLRVHYAPSYPRALVEINADIVLKKEVIMAVLNEDGEGGVDPKVQGADSSYKKINGTSTSNSFDVLNNVDVGDECGISSSMGIQKEDQKAGHATTSKHNSSRWDEDFESDDEVDEVLFPEGDKFGDQFDIRLKGRSRK